jgi:hypothetical protein
MVDQARRYRTCSPILLRVVVAQCLKVNALELSLLLLSHSCQESDLDGLDFCSINSEAFRFRVE